MIFRMFRSIPLHQLFIVTLVGVTSGVYIYKPLLEKYFGERHTDSKKQEESVNASTACTKDTSAGKRVKQELSGALLINIKEKESNTSAKSSL